MDKRSKYRKFFNEEILLKEAAEVSVAETQVQEETEYKEDHLVLHIPRIQSAMYVEKVGKRLSINQANELASS